MADPFEVKARELLPLIYDIAQGKAVASTLVIAIAAALSEAVEAERERCAKIADRHRKACIASMNSEEQSQRTKGMHRAACAQFIAEDIRSTQTARAK